MTPGRPTAWRTILRTGCALSPAMEAAARSDVDARVFHPGTAAHLYLQAVRDGEDPELAVMRAATFGMGDGHSSEPTEAPMSVHAAHEGIDAARAFLASDPFTRLPWDVAVDETGLPVGSRAEVPVALDEGFRACAWDDAAHRTVLDLAWQDEVVPEDYGEDEDAAPKTVAYVLDWKSSWRASGDVDHGANIQRRYQALGGLAAYPEADEVVCMIGSLRERRIYVSTPVHRVCDADLIASWQREVRALEALRHTARASPGPGCHACGGLAACEAGRALLEDADPVLRWAAARSVVNSLEKMVRDRVAGGVELVYGHTRVRGRVTESRKPTEAAPALLARMFAPADGWGAMAEYVESLVTAMRPGVRNLEEGAKAAVRRQLGVQRVSKADREAATVGMFRSVPGMEIEVVTEVTHGDE